MSGWATISRRSAAVRSSRLTGIFPGMFPGRLSKTGNRQSPIGFDATGYQFRERPGPAR